MKLSIVRLDKKNVAHLTFSISMNTSCQLWMRRMELHNYQTDKCMVYAVYANFK